MTGWDWILLAVVGLAVVAGLAFRFLDPTRDDDRNEEDRGGPQ